MANLRTIGCAQVFVVDCDGTEQPIVDLGHLIVSFIEDEKDNDLLDVRSSLRLMISWANRNCWGDLETQN